MLPAGVLAGRAARSQRRDVIGAARWWFRGRKCAGAFARPPAPDGNDRRRYHVTSSSCELRLCARNGIASPAVKGYCSSSSGGGGRSKIQPFLLADIGEGIKEVTVKEWYVKVGDRVSEFDDICEVESDKATVTITSRYAGVVTKVYCETGCMARVGSVLVDIEVEEDGETVVVAAAEDAEQRAAADELVAPEATTANYQARDNEGKVLTTPAVRRIAAEKGIDLTAVRGTGKQGRVLKEDLLGPELSTPAPVVAAAVGSPQTTEAGDQDFIPLTGYSKIMRNTMEASNKIPTMVITDEVNLTRLVELKTQMSPWLKVTILPFLVKATSLALTRHPLLNSTPSPDFSSYRPNRSHNIGVAIDTPLGLVVPNIKNVQTLSLVDLVRSMAQLRTKAENGKLTPADVTGGTFTLSNMGTIMGSTLTPKILPPELAIGALGQMKYRPRYDSQERLVRTPVMNVSWAADHRILDGATVARFFKDWKTYVENPSLILANVEL
ncbi:lipoamide acyltransferase component of branched-chain alpha-keto acid dehydrogenase complex, mitochondrial [Sipha flava]|uniref:Dihydrolipoamide acetyltransferase component of pyruvate dehydrogenase complex n=1 Tax=Sipha flava TaxID=143950 RepID=A0A8B8G8K1_9HEMI|nr:lipoamide acyltransferase component of branched-chain alpha-keto acid dehydrogenase complex, mitochondrial [Sipha flava]